MTVPPTYRGTTAAAVRVIVCPIRSTVSDPPTHRLQRGTDTQQACFHHLTDRVQKIARRHPPLQINVQTNSPDCASPPRIRPASSLHSRRFISGQPRQTLFSICRRIVGSNATYSCVQGGPLKTAGDRRSCCHVIPRRTPGFGPDAKPASEVSGGKGRTGGDAIRLARGMRVSSGFKPRPLRHEPTILLFFMRCRRGRDRLVDAALRCRRDDRSSSSHARRSQRQHR